MFPNDGTNHGVPVAAEMPRRNRANSRLAKTATITNGVIRQKTSNCSIHGVLTHMVAVQKDALAYQTEGNTHARMAVQNPQ